MNQVRDFQFKGVILTGFRPELFRHVPLELRFLGESPVVLFKSQGNQPHALVDPVSVPGTVL